MKRLLAFLTVSAICLLSFAACSSACEHEFADWSTVAAASCTTAGKESRTCLLCDQKEERLVPILGHALGEFVAGDAAACEKNATERATCSRCLAVVTREIEGTSYPHDFATEYTFVKPQSGESYGVKYRACKNPGCTAHQDESSWDPHWTPPIK